MRDEGVGDNIMRGENIIERFRYMTEEEDGVPGGKTVGYGDEKLGGEALEG